MLDRIILGIRLRSAKNYASRVQLKLIQAEMAKDEPGISPQERLLRENDLRVWRLDLARADLKVNEILDQLGSGSKASVTSPV